MKELIVATGNLHKVEEIKGILKDLPLKILSLKDIENPPEIIENGTTFEENAIIKARAISDFTGKMVIADDSGLVIDYINGEPGIYSARYMGEDTSYRIKNNNLIERLKDAKGKERSARFVCAVAIAYPDGTNETVRGVMEGEIAYEEKGENGFGYDPILYLPEYGCTSAELSPEEKNRISHRGKALMLIKDKLK